MNYKQFWLLSLIVVAVCLIVGTVGFFVNRQAEINAKMSIERAKIEQSAETSRTKERWEWTQRIPGFKGDAQKAD